MSYNYIKKLPNRDRKIEIIKQHYKDVNFEIIGSFDGIGNLNRHKIETVCLVCKHIWKVCPDKVIRRKNRSCPKCARKKVGEKNRLIQLQKSLDKICKWGDYKPYIKFVRTYTFQAVKMYNLFSDKIIGKGNGKLTIDHICSKYDCFRNKVPPYITSYPGNLQTLDFLENVKKGTKSWISIDKLKEDYFNWIIAHPEYQNLIDKLPQYTFDK
jgi:hypothetical protein